MCEIRSMPGCAPGDGAPPSDRRERVARWLAVASAVALFGTQLLQLVQLGLRLWREISP